jgi:pilus assembly protein CpaE
MTLQTNPASEATGRATLIVALPDEEQQPVVAELRQAGFAIIEAHTPEDLVELSTTDEPFDMAIVDAAVTPHETADAIAELRARRGAFPTLYVTTGEAFAALETAQIEPDDELVLRPYSADSLRWRVEAMVIRSSADGESGQVDSVVAGEALHNLGSASPILAVFNPKGGVGKTTIATNLAATMQMRRDRRILLVDADTVTGHVALSLGIRGVRGIADTWGDELAGDLQEPLLSLATEHSSGIRVATLTVDPLSLPHLDPDRVANTLLEARAGVDAVIVDLHPSYGDVNLAVFAAATRILVPVTPDLPAVRAAVQLTHVAEELGVRDRLSLIVNRANSGVSVSDIEKTTGLKSVAEIRSAGMLLVRAGNLGKTLAEQFPRERVTGDFDRLADRVLEMVGQGDAARSRSEVRHRGVASLLGAKAATA